jgi:hypothetical protein
MRYAILLGMLLVALPLGLRADSHDPWPAASGYETVARLAQGPLGPVLDAIPLQVVMIALAGAFLGILSLTGRPESFLVILVMTPAFLHTFTTPGGGALAAIVIATGAVLVTRHGAWAVATVPLCFLLGTGPGVLGSLVVIVLAIIRGLPFVALGTSFFALVSSVTVAVFRPDYGLGFIDPSGIMGDLVLGGRGGVTLFLIVLGAIGLLLAYREMKDAKVFLVLLVAVTAPFLEYGDIVLAATLAFLASYAWDYLRDREWRFEELQSITLVLIACSLLFVTIVTVRELADADGDRVALRTFVREAVPPGTRVVAEGDIAGALVADGLVVGDPLLPPDPSFVAGALDREGYRYVVTRDPSPPYAHFPLVFTTRSPTTYRVYAVPDRG